MYDLNTKFKIYKISLFVLEFKICCKFRSWLVLTRHCPPRQEMVVIWVKYRTLVINDLLIDIFDLVTFISILGWVAVIGLVKMLKRNTAPFILLHGGLWRQFVSSFVGASFGRSPMARPLLLSEEDPSSFVYLPYYGVQNIILGTKTLFSGQEHSFGGKNIILGT